MNRTIPRTRRYPRRPFNRLMRVTWMAGRLQGLDPDGRPTGEPIPLGPFTTIGRERDFWLPGGGTQPYTRTIDPETTT